MENAKVENGYIIRGLDGEIACDSGDAMIFPEYGKATGVLSLMDTAYWRLEGPADYLVGYVDGYRRIEDAQ